MLYTTEPYEKIRKLLKSLCVTCSSSRQMLYNISTYRSKSTVYSIQGDGREVYMVGDSIFELDPDGFCVGVPRGRQVQIRLTKFVADSRSMECTQEGDVEMMWTEMNGIEFSVGPVELDGKMVGTLFIFGDTHALTAVGSVLRKFIQIKSQGMDRGFERSLVNILNLSEVL